MRKDNWLSETQEVSIRQMTDVGIEHFQSYLVKIKDEEVIPFPNELLTNEMYVRVLDPNVTVEPRTFTTSLEIIQYLYPRIEALNFNQKFYDAGLWAWLTALYFDSLCAKDKVGRWKVREMACYIPSISRNFRDDKRHLLAASVRMYDSHGENRMKLFLFTPPYQTAEGFRLIMESQDLSSNHPLLDALNILYWDEKTKRPYKGSIKDSPGSLERFISVMNQFNLTFDLFSMTGEQIIELLPKQEFGRWLEKTS